jgi:hypothetical protein
MNENEEIRRAETNMGNYVLKSDPNYEVPTQEIMSVKKQTRMIYLYEEFIYGSKKDFNLSLADMRERKKKLVSKINSANSRIAEIDVQLDKLVDESEGKTDQRKQLLIPEYDEYIEFPEKLLEVSPEEVEALAKKKKKRKCARRWADSVEATRTHKTEMVSQDR